MSAEHVRRGIVERKTWKRTKKKILYHRLPRSISRKWWSMCIVLGLTKTSGVTRCLCRSVQIYSGFPRFTDFFCVNYRIFSRRMGLGIISRSLREVVQRRLAMQDLKKRQWRSVCLKVIFLHFLHNALVNSFFDIFSIVTKSNSSSPANPQPFSIYTMADASGAAVQPHNLVMTTYQPPFCGQRNRVCFDLSEWRRHTN